MNEAGNNIVVTHDDEVPAIIERLKADALASIAPEHRRIEIRRSVPVPGRPEIRQGIAWYWHRSMDRGSDAEWMAEKPGPRRDYILLERCLIPPK